MFQMFKANQLRDVVSGSERIHVVWALSDSEQTPLLSVSQVQSPRARATSGMMTLEVFAGNAGEEHTARRARGRSRMAHSGLSSSRVPSRAGKAGSCPVVEGQGLFFFS